LIKEVLEGKVFRGEKPRARRRITKKRIWDGCCKERVSTKLPARGEGKTPGGTRGNNPFLLLLVKVKKKVMK